MSVKRIATWVAAVSIAAGCTGGSSSDEASRGDGSSPPDVTTPTDVTSTPADDAPTDSAPTDGAGSGEEPGTSGAVADWTVLVYVMGDNDLEPFSIDDLVEMTDVGSTDRVNLVTLTDRHPGYEVDDEPFGDFADTRFFYVEPGDLTEIADPQELNVGAPETLAAFIEEGAVGYPAEHYAVILWNHGAGWPGMGPDESDGGDMLGLAEISQGFADGLAAAGLERVDLVGFDACLMASYEVARTMSEHADYMLASEELEPGHGWNYQALETLVDDPETSPDQLGAAIIDGFAGQAADFGTDEDITLSLLDLGAMAPLAQSLADLAAPIVAEPTLAAQILARAQAAALKFGASPDPTVDAHHVDLGQVFDALSADPALAEPAAAARRALDEVVVSSTSGPATASATGMSIYFPPFGGVFDQDYLDLPGSDAWPGLLTSFYDAGAAIPPAEQPAFENADGQAEYFFDEDGLNIFGTFDLAAQGNLVEAEIFYGVLDEGDGSIIFIGEEPGEVSTDGSGVAAAIYDLTVLTISDGIDTDYAYLDLAIDEELGVVTIDVPLWYIPPEEFETDDPPRDVVLSLVLDLDFNILSEVYYSAQPDGTFGELAADPEGLIFPVVLNEYPDGTQEWLTLSEQGLFANLPDLQYDLEPLEPGTGLYAELVLRDYGGNVDSVSMLDVVP